ncbi:MAG: exodeoxyribonuclease V subunit alpha [Desulfobacterales bacterium]
MDKKAIEILVRKGTFSDLDVHFAEFMQKLDRRNDTGIFLAAAAVSSSTRQGNICLDVEGIANRPLLPEYDLYYPGKETWIERLKTSPVVGTSRDFKPLILDGSSKLYLHRYFEYQKDLVQFIKNRVVDHEYPEPSGLQKSLNRLFGEVSGRKAPDWQKIAAILAATRKFCVLSGGPGTGKTTTIVKLMALLLERNHSKPLKTALAVPTGKAAVKLQDSIREALEALNCSDEVKALMPDEASTIHRLLGTIPGSPYFRYNEQNRLDVDVVIVDESSMVDLALLAKLVRAIPDHAKLILVGDKDQLASVEAGSVFADICDAAVMNGFTHDFYGIIDRASGEKIMRPDVEPPENRIKNCMIQLLTNYRFGDKSGIGKVSSAVNEGNGPLALMHVKDPQYPDIRIENVRAARGLKDQIKNIVIPGFRDYLIARTPQDKIDAFGKFRILCALKEGPFGVFAVNRMIEEILTENKLIRSENSWYEGRPIMIVENDYNLRLFNGDVGISMVDPIDQEVRVFFPDNRGGLRKFHPTRIGSHETVFAMTVHKSQGSEFENVILLLPDRESPVLTRELLYTGITRSQKHVLIWGDEQIFIHAVAKRVTRVSGLKDALSEIKT